MAIHSSDARKQLAEFHIGTLVGEKASKEEVNNDDESGPFLNEKRWKKVILVSIKDISRDSKLYRFTLQRPDQELGLPLGQHVYVRLRRKNVHKEEAEVVEGEVVQRAYTPLSGLADRGFIDILVKYVVLHY
jgi:Flavodoxin reductases (ferredoxin-NADPH reductases) family 1